MALAWIKIEKATPRKPEILRLSEILQIHPDEAFGMCFRFWSWCDDQLKTGHAFVTKSCDKSVTHVTLDRVIGHAGFASALEEVGWIEVEGGQITVPNFDRHLSQSAKNRADSAERQQKRRHKNVTKNCDKSVTREEKRREDKYKGKDPLPPAVLIDPISQIESEFIASWNAAKGVVACRGDSLTPKRRQAIRCRLKDAAWDWRAALAKFPLKLVASDPNGWKPDVDWFLRPDSVARILEGKYDWAKSDKKTGASLFGPGQTYDPNASERDSDHGKL